ncbi:hypothetical protein [Paludisphaera soli]|uniref:hypothetical protein n=1 Tax=Paludisphaera soli TaxID=2712865 RepID=UPI0013ED75A0|nr:hypothetical protein [Paludisphaera soli]
MSRNRSTILVARVLGIMFLIPGLLQIPLPQADFHIIRHHHGAGEICPQHDHLLRWHPQAGDCDGQGVAVLHWHWLLPKSLDPSLLDGDARTTPSLHAHEGDAPQPEPAAATLIAREDRGRDVGRLLSSLAIDLVTGHAAWFDHPPPAISPSILRGTESRCLAPSVGLSRLARWNC